MLKVQEPLFSIQTTIAYLLPNASIQIILGSQDFARHQGLRYGPDQVIAKSPGKHWKLACLEIYGGKNG